MSGVGGGDGGGEEHIDEGVQVLPALLHQLARDVPDEAA